jgi:hypothetical protein
VSEVTTTTKVCTTCGAFYAVTFPAAPELTVLWCPACRAPQCEECEELCDGSDDAQ